MIKTNPANPLDLNRIKTFRPFEGFSVKTCQNNKIMKGDISPIATCDVNKVSVKKSVFRPDSIFCVSQNTSVTPAQAINNADNTYTKQIPTLTYFPKRLAVLLMPTKASSSISWQA